MLFSSKLDLLQKTPSTNTKRSRKWSERTVEARIHKHYKEVQALKKKVYGMKKISNVKHPEKGKDREVVEVQMKVQRK